MAFHPGTVRAGSSGVRRKRPVQRRTALTAEVVLPPLRRGPGIQARLFLWIVLAFLLLATPLFVTASLALRASIHREYAERSLRESELLAGRPEVRAALARWAAAGPEDAAARAALSVPLNRTINRDRALLRADYITVTDRQTLRLTHPDPRQLLRPMVGGDFTRFLQGRSLTETVRGTLGESVRAKVPVLGEEGQVLGLVSVGFLLPRLQDLFWAVTRGALPPYVGVLLLSLLGAGLLSRRIRREMLGLEPEQIVGVALHYRTVLHALEEGVLVLRGGQVQSLNPQARRLLGLPDELALPLPLTRALPDWGELHPRLAAGETPISLPGGRPLLLALHPAPDGTEIVTLRDHARVRALADELSGARQYAELLRSQAHEFGNRLHTIAGLIHLGETQEALALIRQRGERQARLQVALAPLRHRRLMALILGKVERAGELGVDFALDPHSALPGALPPETLALLELAAGTLIDNALEAVTGRAYPRVRLLVATDPEGLQLEVRDSGPGVSAELAGRLMRRGVSGKGEGRGIGLAMLRLRARALGGELSHQRQEKDPAKYPEKPPELSPEMMGRDGAVGEGAGEGGAERHGAETVFTLSLPPEALEPGPPDTGLLETGLPERGAPGDRA